MELNDKLLSEISVPHQSLFFPENDISIYPNNNEPYMKDEFPLEVCSSKTFLQDFQHLDNKFHAPVSSSNPMFGVQSGYNFESFDAFSYGSLTNIDFYEYECKPFADSNNNGGQVQVLDNFLTASGGGYLNLPQRNHIHELIGSSTQRHMSLTLQEMKQLNILVPDEVSCASEYYKKLDIIKIKPMPSSARNKTWKGREKNNVVKGQWTVEEDRLLIQLVEQHGVRKWSHIAQMLPGRIGKQCRERWHNHLRPDIKKHSWDDEEDKVLIQTHAEVGNKWAEIAKKLPGRTENSIKNHWNATKRRQYSKRGCRSRYPGGSLLQDYIRSLNLDQTKANFQQSISSTTDPIADKTAMKAPIEQALNFCQNDRLVPSYDFNEVPAFDFDEKMFQESYSIDSLLDGIPCAPVVDAKTLAMDLLVDEHVTQELKRELDLVEMISQANDTMSSKLATFKST
ncbi:hypothetical protein K2173_026970 [Erythroxylum novogranatense]|uniref:Uncharacterized protein n=1 Tax=Erythroxylum novogranatense TaxID=1862640 RepID=A0AAV8TY16_9ROSI|nr:hypothetical protein K2173_026970 [Erythroxylum novogranatense]